jgi:hypothetical protein
MSTHPELQVPTNAKHTSQVARPHTTLLNRALPACSSLMRRLSLLYSSTMLRCSVLGLCIHYSTHLHCDPSMLLARLCRLVRCKLDFLAFFIKFFVLDGVVSYLISPTKYMSNPLDTEPVNLEESPVRAGATSQVVFHLMPHLGAIQDFQHSYMIPCESDRRAGLTIATGLVTPHRPCESTSVMTIIAVTVLH